MESVKIKMDDMDDELVLRLDDDYKDDNVLYDVDLEDTMELSLDQIQDVWEKTVVVDRDDFYHG